LKYCGNNFKRAINSMGITNFSMLEIKSREFELKCTKWGVFKIGYNISVWEF
jgi:hypothetical protein